MSWYLKTKIFFFLIALKFPEVCSEWKLIKGPVDEMLYDHVIKTMHI